MTDDRLAMVARIVAGKGVMPDSADYDTAREILAALTARDAAHADPVALRECLRTILRVEDYDAPVTKAEAVESERVGLAIIAYGESVRRAALKAPTIDYRSLLVRYMAQVLDAEGLSYAEEHVAFHAGLAAEERQAIVAVEREARQMVTP